MLSGQAFRQRPAHERAQEVRSQGRPQSAAVLEEIIAWRRLSRLNCGEPRHSTRFFGPTNVPLAHLPNGPTVQQALNRQKKGREVMCRRRRQHIDRLPFSSSPDRTRCAGLRSGARALLQTSLRRLLFFVCGRIGALNAIKPPEA